MKFKASPKLFVKISNKYVQRATGKKGLFFDDNGEYETDNEVLVKVLSQHFEVIETPIETPVEVADENTETERHCKKCDFVCITQKDILAHYRSNHPKGGGK